jgi:hypothetical protein
MSLVRRHLTRLAPLCASILLLWAASASAQTDNYKVLHGFCGPACGDGSLPNPVIGDSAGNLFGSTVGGVNYRGEVFELRHRPDGSYKYEILYHFGQLIDPIGGLVMDTAGNLYGVAEGLDSVSNPGLVFELSPSKSGWTEKTLYLFCRQLECVDGIFPLAGLAYANQRSGVPYDGKSPLFGTTGLGGTTNVGTLFKLQPGKDGWKHTKLHDFCLSGTGGSCADGAYPQSQLLLDASGNIFGTTTYGGAHGGYGYLSGTVFELSPTGKKWRHTVLYSFCGGVKCADGAFPESPLSFDASGALYGFAVDGGGTCVLPQRPEGCGVAFRIVPDGENSQETVLYDFCITTGCHDGAHPRGTPFLDGNGNLLGVAIQGGELRDSYNQDGGGTVFEFSLADPESTYQVLHRFCQKQQCDDGAWPEDFVIDPSGAIVGSAAVGGRNAGQENGGAVFRLVP